MKKVFIFILIVLVGFVGFVYNEFNGNPVSKYLANREMQKYISTNYSDKNLEIIKVDYNFKLKNYIATVQLKKEGTKYNIEKLSDGSYYDEYYNNEIIDPRFSRRMGEELSQLIYKDLKDRFPELSTVAANFEIIGGKYPLNMEYTKEIEEKPEIIIGFQGNSITKEEFLHKVFLVKEDIISDGYKPRGFHISYNGFGEKGALIYSMKLEENQLNFSKEQLNNIKIGYDTGTKDELKELAVKNKFFIGGPLIIISIGVFITIFEKKRSVSI